MKRSIMAKTTHEIEDSPELRQTQTTLNDLIEKETGAKPGPDTIFIPVAAITRTRTKPGYKNLFLTLNEGDYNQLVISADGRPVPAWLSRLVAGNIAELVRIHKEGK
jgi:hypothetical protein